MENEINMQKGGRIKEEAMEYELKDRLTAYVKEFMLALLIVQPLLDVLSYFMMQNSGTAFTTALRMILLVTVSIYGFIISNHKQKYLALYSVIIIFWLLHMFNCLRYGYQAPLQDIAEYLKLIQFPVWTAAFITFFHKAENLNLKVVGAVAANLLMILAVIMLSYMFRNPVYTYDYPARGIQIGVLGWFGVANAQSAILVMVVPIALLWAFRKESLLYFSTACVLGFGLLYFTGTRLTYYGALIIAVVFLAVILINYRDYFLFGIPLVLSIALLLAFRGISPMMQRQVLTMESYQTYQEKTDAVMGEDKDFVYREGEEIPQKVLEKIERVYTEVYGGTGAHGNALLGELVERFGVEKVMEVYRYSINSEELYNLRVKRANCVKLIQSEHGFITKLLGFEYNEVYIGGVIFDPENDFPAMLAFYGYLGTALYIGMLLYLGYLAIRELLQDFPGYLTMETAVAGICLVLGLGAAQLSGQVLRKPSVTVYLSLAAALLYISVYPPQFRRYGKYQKSRVVHMKHF